MAFPYMRHQANWQSGSAGGTPITEAAMDNIEAGIDSLSDILELADAAGDILVASGADAWTKLAKGADDEVLSVSAGSLDYRKIVNAMVDAAAAIAYSKLNLAGSIVNADVATAAAIARSKIVPVSLSTSLPGSPSNGDQVILVDSTSAPTYAWLLQYVAAKASDKWVFIGGTPANVAVQDDATEETTTSTSYTALATAGPSFAIPVAGTYDVGIGFTGGHTAVFHLMSYDIGATGAVDADAVRQQNAALADPVTSVFRWKRKVLTAVTLTAKYRGSGAGTSSFANRIMIVQPVAIGG